MLVPHLAHFVHMAMTTDEAECEQSSYAISLDGDAIEMR